MDADNGSKTESLHYIIMINVVFQGEYIFRLSLIKNYRRRR